MVALKQSSACCMGYVTSELHRDDGLGRHGADRIVNGGGETNKEEDHGNPPS
jgi:hypothetical protein